MAVPGATGTLGAPRSPTPVDVATIAAQADAVQRNLQITQCYFELSAAFRARSGVGAYWCSFATWASRQAGRTIRREDLRATLHERLARSPGVHALGTAALAALRAAGAGRSAAGERLSALLREVMDAVAADAALERAAASVAAGNLKVFEEIGALFAQFLGVLDDPGARAAFLAGLRDGDPPDGQRLLREAFEAYVEALAADAPLRAQRIFHANLLIGMHEQTRLQPQIAAAMNCAFDADAVRRRLLARLLPGAWRAVRYRVAAWLGRRPPLDHAIARLLAAVQRELRHVLTSHAMSLQLPGGLTVRLGHDLQATPPPSLRNISDPRLAELLRTLDPSPESTAGSGAADWSDLRERLHFIAELFRCYHESEVLFERE